MTRRAHWTRRTASSIETTVQNPFRDFAVVFVPYCTGDVHIGDASRKYGDDPSTRPVAHRGFRNAQAVLSWLGAQKRSPRTVVVSGSATSVRMAQVTTDRDAVQHGFYILSGSPRARDVTYQLLEDVRRAVPAFRSFVLDGTDHGLFPTDAFYTYQVNGIYLKDWVGRLVRGEPVDDVRCAGCAGKVTRASPPDQCVTLPQHILYFRPLPHGHGSFRPILTLRTGVGLFASYSRRA